MPTDSLVSTRVPSGPPAAPSPTPATTGRVVLHEESYADGVFSGTEAKAQVFLTAYTLDDADPREERPVAFVFNGGPGSASVWLHLGLLGPRRVVAGDAGRAWPRHPAGSWTTPKRFDALGSRLVDPMSTGYSRAVDGQKPGDCHGFAADIESIPVNRPLWTSRNGRWLSPEIRHRRSYGTLRGAHPTKAPPASPRDVSQRPLSV